MKKTTAERLKQIMKEENLKQVDILERSKKFCKIHGTKLTKTDLSQYVSGKVEPRQDKLCILALSLNVNEAWLMGFEVSKSPFCETDSTIKETTINAVETVIEDEDYRAIVNSSALLNPDEMKMVRAMIDGLIRSKNIQNNEHDRNVLYQ